MYKLSKFDKSSKRLHFYKKAICILIYIIIIPTIIWNFTLMIKSLINPDKIPDFFGIKSFVIVSRSMEPNIMVGDAIFVKEVKQEDLNEGDIISFHDGQDINTHRIIEIIYENGETFYKTQGDNNKSADRELIIFDKIEGKYQFKINGFGKFNEILKNRITLVILLIILILISVYQVRLNKRKLSRKEKRYNYNKEIER